MGSLRYEGTLESIGVSYAYPKELRGFIVMRSQTGSEMIYGCLRKESCLGGLVPVALLSHISEASMRLDRIWALGKKIGS